MSGNDLAHVSDNTTNGTMPVGWLPASPTVADAVRDPDAYLFGPFCLVPKRWLLTRDGRQVKLGSRSFLLLVALTRQAGRVVERDALMQAAWPDATVSETNLRTQIAGLRRALDAGEPSDRWIVSIPGRGYQLATTVREGVSPRLE